MIRLLIVSEDELRWRGVASRFAGVTVEVCRDPAGHLDSPEDCHAVVLDGPQPAEKNAIEGWLRAGKHVLYAAEPSLSWNDFESLWEVAQQREVQFAVVNPDRYLPSRQIIGQQIPDKLGQA